VVTFVGLALALLLASLANAKIRGLVVYRSLLLWPYGIAPAIAGVIWLFIFHPSYGILPWLLGFVTTYQFNWFLRGWVALTLIVVAAIWKQFGYNPACRRSTPRSSRPPAWTAPGRSGASSP
jgi:sn-glycerol 3-phosphate transport system permease protein